MADVSSNVPVYIPMQMNIREYGREIKNGQSRETGNIFRVHKTKKNKRKTQHNTVFQLENLGRGAQS